MKCKPWIRHFSPPKFHCFSSQFALHGLRALEFPFWVCVLPLYPLPNEIEKLLCFISEGMRCGIQGHPTLKKGRGRAWAVPGPVLPCLVFLENGRENPANKQVFFFFFYPCWTLKIPGNEGGNAQRKKKFLAVEKGNQRKGKEGQGTNQRKGSSRPHLHEVPIRTKRALQSWQSGRVRRQKGQKSAISGRRLRWIVLGILQWIFSFFSRVFCVIQQISVEPKVRLQGYGCNPFCSHSSRCLAVLVWQYFEEALCAPEVRLKWYGFKGFSSHSSHCSGGLFPQYSGVSPKSPQMWRKSPDFQAETKV